MSGVGQGQPAVGGDVRGEAGGEAVVRAAYHAVVERAEQRRGAGSVGGLGTDCANQNRDQHGGRQALAADVADHEQDAAPAIADLLEEVSSHLIGGLVDALDCEAGALVLFAGKKNLLDLAGGLEFAGQPDLAATGAGKAKNQEDHHGKQKYKMEEDADFHGEGRQRQ